MTYREKVIKGLEKIAEFFKARGDMAVGDGKMLLLSWMRAAEDAIALLKAQEPRVMTLEEVKALQPDTDIWIEVRFLNTPIRFSACTVSGFSPGGTRLLYNNFFRCWTSRPTDEQREAIAWQKPENN